MNKDNHDWDILNVEVKTRSSSNKISLSEDLKIKPEKINEAFIEQPAKFAYWATVAAQSRAIADRAKLNVERQEDYLKKTLIGELDVEVRRQLEMDGEKITETKVTNGIYCHPKYLQATEELYELKEAYLEANSRAVSLEIGRDAMNQRKDALISLGAQMRNDANNLELSTLKSQAKSVMRGE